MHPDLANQETGGHIAAISGSVSEGKGRNRDTKATVEDSLWETSGRSVRGSVVCKQASKAGREGESSSIWRRGTPRGAPT
jgi:hypothetical protein